MTDDERGVIDAVLDDYVFELTHQICDELDCRPPAIWRGSKKPPVPQARKLMAVRMRLTIGRRKRADRYDKESCPWTVFREGIPKDHEPYSYPQIASWLGGNHTTYLIAVRAHYEEETKRLLEENALNEPPVVLDQRPATV